MRKCNSGRNADFWWDRHSCLSTLAAGTFLSLPRRIGQTFLSARSALRQFFGGTALLALALSLSVCGCTTTTSVSPTAHALPAAEDEPSPAEAWKTIAQTLGKQGELKDGVYTVTFPRDDLTVRIEGMDVPTGAGLESVFHFYQCSCGKTVVIGQFVCTDYEANDVAYALQKENLLVSAMSPYLLYEKPRLMAVRFQAEGKPQPLAAAIHSALQWTGKNRIPPPEKLPP